MNDRPSVLAIDLATSTGWAFYRAGDDKPSYGLLRLQGGDEGDVLNRYGRWLHGAIAVHRPSRIVFEAPFVQNVNAVARLFGLAAVTQFLAKNNDRTAYKVTPAEWRKHFLGAGNGGRADLKKAVMGGCELRGWAPADDNVADALGVLDFACQRWNVPVPWPRSPIEAQAVMAREGAAHA